MDQGSSESKDGVKKVEASRRIEENLDSLSEGHSSPRERAGGSQRHHWRSDYREDVPWPK
jgi:hypothetical protein